MAGVEGTRSGWLAVLARHWRALLRGVLLLLVAIIVLQNIEPTSFDVLFWSVGRVPKLVLILGSMLVGIGGWELLKALRRR